jgi:hypothetical protein
MAPVFFCWLSDNFWGRGKFLKIFLKNPKVPQTRAVTLFRSAAKGSEKIFSENPQVLARRSVKEWRGQQKIEKIFCENPKVLQKLDVNRIKRTTEARSSVHNLAGSQHLPKPLFHRGARAIQ